MSCSRKMIPVAVLVLMSGQLPTSAQTAAASFATSESWAYSANDTGRLTSMCRIQMLEEQGYRYTVPQIQEMVLGSEVVVRAVAVDSTRTLDGASSVRFRTTELLHGPFREAEFTLRGHFVDEDGFNTLSVPYQLLRAAGGSCYAEHYRQGGEYLFLLNQVEGRDSLTPYWFPLSPTNEQIRGADDPWVQWVREQLAEAPAPGSQPPLP